MPRFVAPLDLDINSNQLRVNGVPFRELAEDLQLLSANLIDLTHEADSIVEQRDPVPVFGLYHSAVSHIQDEPILVRTHWSCIGAMTVQ